MDFVAPSTFPEDFHAFGIAARRFLPALLSDDFFADTQEKRQHFTWSWQAVRYRYRSCVESNEEFKTLLNNPSEEWQSGWGDEELAYRLERCIYVFFMSALSVFDSFAFCLYFSGNGIQPGGFDIAHPRKITRRSTHAAFVAAFPQAAITELLGSLESDSRFVAINDMRNLLAHRLSGGRSVRSSSTIQKDGTDTNWREETFYVPGGTQTFNFDGNMLQRHLDDLTALLSSLASAGRTFAESAVAMSGAAKSS